MAKKSRSRTAPTNVPKVSVAPASPDGPNRKVRKEEARRQREQLQRKATRRKLYRWGVVGLAVVVVLVAGTIVVLNNNSNSSANPGPSPTPSVLVGHADRPRAVEPGTDRPQGAPRGHRRPVRPAGDARRTTSTTCVQIYVDGEAGRHPGRHRDQHRRRPRADQFIAALHTHDASGIVHIESPDKRDYTLGQFFDVWGVRLSSTCLGAPYCNVGRQAGPGVLRRQALHEGPAGHRVQPAPRHRGHLRNQGPAAQADPGALLGARCPRAARAHRPAADAGRHRPGRPTLARSSRILLELQYVATSASVAASVRGRERRGWRSGRAWVGRR